MVRNAAIVAPCAGVAVVTETARRGRYSMNDGSQVTVTGM